MAVQRWSPEVGESEYESMMVVDPPAPLDDGTPVLRVRPFRRLGLRDWLRVCLRPLHRKLCRHRFLDERVQHQVYMLQRRVIVDCECRRCGAWMYVCRAIDEIQLTRSHMGADAVIAYHTRSAKLALAAAAEKESRGWWRFL